MLDLADLIGAFRIGDELFGRRIGTVSGKTIIRSRPLTSLP